MSVVHLFGCMFRCVGTGAQTPWTVRRYGGVRFKKMSKSSRRSSKGRRVNVSEIFDPQGRDETEERRPMSTGRSESVL